MNRNRWKISPLELYSNNLVYTQLQKKHDVIYPLPKWSILYVVENANKTSRQLKDNYLITTRIVNRAFRATLNEFLEKCTPLSWGKPHVLKAVFETISQFSTGTFSWIHVKFVASDTKQKCNKCWKKVVRT